MWCTGTTAIRLEASTCRRDKMPPVLSFWLHFVTFVDGGPDIPNVQPIAAQLEQWPAGFES